MSAKLSEISDSSFEKEVLQSELPVVVDFWAPWCAPCKRIAPILEEIAAEYEGKVVIKKMNIDDNPKTPSDYSVRGIPNLIFVKDGQMVDQLVGAVPKDSVVSAIKAKLLA